MRLTASTEWPTIITRRCEQRQLWAGGPDPTTAASFTGTRSYNANLQLAELVSGAYHFEHNYSAMQNNARIQSQTDVASGETNTYQYDSLNRLIQASGTGDPQGAWSRRSRSTGLVI
jgi:hypothetical protein